MSKPKDKPLTLGSATVGPVRKLTMKDLLADAKPAIVDTCKREGMDLVQDPGELGNEVDKDAVAARLVKHAVLNRYGMYNSAASGDPSVYLTPIWIRGDGSIPWEHPPLAETEEAMRHAAEDVAQEVLKADEAMRHAAEDVARAAADLAEEFQARVRNSACAAAQWTWDALGNFAEHQAPPIADAVEIALRHAANEASATAKEKRWAELAREAAETTEAKDNPRDWIAREVHPHLGALRDKLRAVGMKVWRPFLYTDEPPEDDAVEAAETADNLLADYLAAELDAASIAKNIRNSIAERQENAHQHDTNGNEERGKAWMLWFNPVGDPPMGPFPFLTLLALAVWRAKVRPELEAERKRAETALSRVGALQGDLFDVLLRGTLAPDVSVQAAGSRDDLHYLAGKAPRIVDGSDTAVGWFHGGAVASLRKASRALEQIRSPAGIVLLCTAAERIAYQVAMEARSPTTTRHPGATDFARELGLKTKGLRELLDAFHGYSNREIQGLFTYGFTKPAPGRLAETVLTWNSALFATRALLTPTPDPRDLPDFGKRMQRRGLFSWLLAHWHMAEGSRELVRHGDVVLPFEEIRRDALITNKRSWFSVLDILLGERGQGPYLLRGSRPNSFLLADKRRHAFLVEQGTRRERNAEGGKRAAEKARRLDGKFATGKKAKERTR